MVSSPSDLSSLTDLRHQIDVIDSAICDLLQQRIQIALQIGRLKQNHQIPFLQPDREAEILHRITGLFPPSLHSFIHSIWTQILAMSRTLEAETP